MAVRVSRSAGGVLGLAFSLEGTLAELQIPAPHAPGVGHELWRHTCFEAFIAAEDGPAYHELNLSPSGEWSVRAFRDYRDRVPFDAREAPRVAVRREGDRLAMDVEVGLGSLAPAYRAAALRVAVSAVVEARSGACSYWALHHRAGRPDFHHRDAFVLLLSPNGER
jgi:hypothetical protein